MNTELAIKISNLVHNECKNVPSDIGFKVAKLVEEHKNEVEASLQTFSNTISFAGSKCFCVTTRATPRINGIYICSICNKPIL